MAKVNIPKSVDDPFYRYQRNKLQVKTAKANTTILLNLNTIAHQIQRPSDKLVKMLKKATGVSIYSKDVEEGYWC